MNIFYLDHNVAKCAEMHVDRHCVKMILEYAQLLSTAHHIIDRCSVSTPHIYKPTHVYHPSAIWVRQSNENYNWLYSLLESLLSEYTFRYGKNHATARLLPYLAKAPNGIPIDVFTEPTPAMPFKFKIEGNSIQSYRNYYNGSKQHLFSWKHRPVPSFVINSDEQGDNQVMISHQ